MENIAPARIATFFEQDIFACSRSCFANRGNGEASFCTVRCNACYKYCNVNYESWREINDEAAKPDSPLALLSVHSYIDDTLDMQNSSDDAFREFTSHYGISTILYEKISFLRVCHECIEKAGGYVYSIDLKEPEEEEKYIPFQPDLD